MGDLKTSVIVDLKGNLEARARRNGDAINSMSRRGISALSRLNRGWKKHSKTLNKAANKYTAIIGLGTAAAAGKNVIDRDARLTQLQTDGRVTEDQIKNLKAQLLGLSNDKDIRLNPDKILGGFEEIITRTGDFDFAIENLRNLALTIRATNSEGKDVGAVFSNFYKAGIRDAEELLKITDTIVLQTFQGSVAFRDVAKVGNKLFAPAVASMGAGEETLIDAGAVAQIVIDAVGSGDEATEAIKAFISFLNKKEVQKSLKGAGIDIKKDDGKLNLLSNLIPQIFKAAKGDFGVLGKLFGESGVKVFQGFSLKGNDEKLKELSKLRTDGSLLQKNARTNASTAKAGLQSLGNKTLELADNLISDASKDAANASDTFGKTNTSTNIAAINYALGKSVTEPIKFIGQGLIDGNQAGGQFIVDSIKGLFSDEFKATVEIKVDGAAKVTGVKSQSSNLDIEVDTGKQMVSQ